MLYPVLHRLERQGLIQSQWGASDTGRRRKYYRLSDEGTGALEREREQWMTVHTTLSKLWKEQSCSVSMKPLPSGAPA